MKTPTQMKAVVVRAYAPGFDNLALTERPVLAPVGDQVLVRVAASPINPSDLSFVQGRYGVRKPLPAVGGFEASGLVVAAGEGAAAELIQTGMAPALCSADADFEPQLTAMCKTLDARIAVDAVGGALTGRVARALRPGGRVIVYGGLSGEEPRIGADQLIFQDKKLEGFWLSSWLPGRPAEELSHLAAEIPALARDTLSTDTRARYPLDSFREALSDYAGQMSGGKVLFMPQAS